ncbi:MAG: hypothetical protein NZ108_06090 [Bacteroidia bacterium]|nr:hypothetical protein [Bacteroidia bacterium]
MNEKQADEIARLKKLLFAEESKFIEDLRYKVYQLEQEVKEEVVRAKVAPTLEKKIMILREDIETLTGPAITKAIKRQIQDSREEVISALYPIMGQLIRRYVQVEIEKLNEIIDRRVDELFTWQGIQKLFRNLLKGKTPSEQIITNLYPAKLLQVILIHQHSGLIVAEYSPQTVIDQDMMAGMLSAIKSFAEDSLQASKQQLETLHYNTYRIIIQSWHHYYMAAVLEGTVNQTFAESIRQKMDEFAELYLVTIDKEFDEIQKKDLSLSLQSHFESFTHESN